ncbi:MAG: peptidylprolyl isomerase [Burkholderiaceae bacterium]|nr:peptidylprolyl isomerase [Burkholderiaceae bacterium]
MTRDWRMALALLGAVGLLAGCGGSSDEQKPSVNSMAFTPAQYGRSGVWTVSGLNLDKGIRLAITSGSCEGLTEVGGGTALQRQFTCRPASTGELIGQANELGGKEIARLRVIIPAPVVQLSLGQGTIELELDPERAPVTVQNFLNYVNGSFYNNTIFHRVIADFVIQGGGFAPGSPNPVPKTPTQPPIVLESNNGLLNLRGTLAMARLSDPNSASSQFFINVVDNPFLDYRSEQEPGYAVFGRVTAGMDVVDAISIVPTKSVPSLGLTDVPVTDVIVRTARQLR